MERHPSSGEVNLRCRTPQPWMSPVRPAAGVLDAVAPSVRWAVATTRGARASRRTCPRHAHRALGPRSSSRSSGSSLSMRVYGITGAATTQRPAGDDLDLLRVQTSNPRPAGPGHPAPSISLHPLRNYTHGHRIERKNLACSLIIVDKSQCSIL